MPQAYNKFHVTRQKQDTYFACLDQLGLKQSYHMWAKKNNKKEIFLVIPFIIRQYHKINNATSTTYACQKMQREILKGSYTNHSRLEGNSKLYKCTSSPFFLFFFMFLLSLSLLKWKILVNPSKFAFCENPINHSCQQHLEYIICC